DHHPQRDRREHRQRGAADLVRQQPQQQQYRRRRRRHQQRSTALRHLAERGLAPCPPNRMKAANGMHVLQGERPMTKIMSASTALAALVIAMLYGSPAEALNVKSFVANTGNDGFSCADAPNACKTFSGALSKTIAGGEITVINAGD